MVQNLIVYSLVAAALAWTVWRLVLPASVRNRLRSRAGLSERNGCGGGCSGCGGGSGDGRPPVDRF